MKVNDSYLPSAATTGASRAQETEKLGAGARQGNGLSKSAGDDDVHLSELVRSLRSLAAESPERQDQIEYLARAAAAGTYRVDVEATASRMIDDAIRA